MATQSIGNAPGAFGETQIPDAPGIMTVLNSGSTTINVNEWVQMDKTGTGSHVFGAIRGLHGNAPAAFSLYGIALDTIAPGAYGRICTNGPCYAIAGATIASGNPIQASTTLGQDGQVIAAATPTQGGVIGMAMAAATAGNLVPIIVQIV